MHLRTFLLAITLIPLFSGCTDHGIAPVFVRADGVELSAEKIDARVDELMNAAEVVGLGLALISEGEIAYLKTFGMAKLETAMPLETDTVMYGASFTKSAFAYMVMTLVDEGVVNLDQPISHYLPQPLDQYPNYLDLSGDPRWRTWTMRILLSHQSGLWNWRWFHPDEKLELLFEPGTRYAYSGEGIQVAQLVLEEGLGLDVNALMQQRVFDRFGMHRTSMTWREDFKPNFARSHDKDGNNLGHNLWDELGAAGSMDTTPADFARFVAGVSRGEGLSEPAMNEMLSPQVQITSKHQFPTQIWEDTDRDEAIKLAYGLGWGLFESRFGPAFFKEGHDEGTNNYVLCLRKAQRCIMLMSNSANGESIFLYLVDSLLGETGLPWEWERYVPYDHGN